MVLRKEILLVEWCAVAVGGILEREQCFFNQHFLRKFVLEVDSHVEKKNLNRVS